MGEQAAKPRPDRSIRDDDDLSAGCDRLPDRLGQCSHVLWWCREVLAPTPGPDERGKRTFELRRQRADRATALATSHTVEPMPDRSAEPRVKILERALVILHEDLGERHPVNQRSLLLQEIADVAIE